MPCTLKWEEQGVVARFTGVVINEDLIQCTLATYEHPIFNTMKYQIVDFLLADEIALDVATIKKVSLMDINASKQNAHMKIAVVATSILVKGLARLYELSGVSQAWPVDIFHTEKEARIWLQE